MNTMAVVIKPKNIKNYKYTKRFIMSNIIVKVNDEIKYLAVVPEEQDLDSRIYGYVKVTDEPWPYWKKEKYNNKFYIFTDYGYLDTYDDNKGEELVIFSKKTKDKNQLFILEGGELISSKGKVWFGKNKILRAGKSTKNFNAEFYWGDEIEIKGEDDPSSVSITDLDNLVKLDSVLNIYNYKFLSIRSANLVRLAYINKLHEKTFLFKSNPKVSDKDILLSLKYRYPVYYGEPKTEMYKDKTLKRVLNITTNEITNKISGSIVQNARYAICGPVLGVSEKQLRQDVWVIHVWGVNFETKITEDYKTMVKNGIINQDEYYARCEELYTSIKECCKIINETTGQQVLVNIPGIGQGAFLSAVNDNQKIVARNIHKEVKSEVFNKKVKSVEVYKKANLFDIPAKKDGIIFVIVNAWDTRSFVGNGGGQDPTIDGYMVSGLGSGVYFPNSSYLHNSFFSINLFNPDLWYE